MSGRQFLATKIFASLALLLLANTVNAQQLPAADDGFEPMAFVNYESPHVHPLDLTPSKNTLLAVNTAAATLMVFDVSGGSAVLTNSIPVGLEPVSVRARSESEAWVVNHVSDTVSIVDLNTGIVVNTLQTADEPADVIFAGNPERAFVSASQDNLLQVFNVDNPDEDPTDITILGEDPRALAKSPDGNSVYLAIFESGNGTTLMPGGKRIDDRIRDAAGASQGPYGGESPPPNDGNRFNPPMNSSNPTPPPVGVIVRKDDNGNWFDDNNGNWTELVTGNLSFLSDRVEGWDLPDRDVAIIDANTFSVRYQTRLMNIVMALDVNPASGAVTVVGTESTNEVRFEPNLKSRFVRVHMGSFGANGGNASINDLNAHLNYNQTSVAQSVRDQSVGDPRAIAWNSSGTQAYIAGLGSNNIVAVSPSGARFGRIEVGQGPTGIALDDARSRGYVLNRFGGSISVISLGDNSESSRTSFFDPTPSAIKNGRQHLYDTHATSGLGQASCASCHVDARTDRLSWDLGNPAGSMSSRRGFEFHPMKGPLKTQSLQDIIGAPGLHHRGDRETIFDFAITYENLHGLSSPLDEFSMGELEAYLDTIHFGPNPNRNIDNTLSSLVPLPGANGTIRGFGNAQDGLRSFQSGNNTSSTCGNCHLGPRSRGDIEDVSRSFMVDQPVLAETFSGFYDRIGLFWNSTDGSTAGFGFRPDGAQSSEFQHRNRNFDLNTESGTHLFAYQLSIEGPLPQVSGFSRDSHAGVGQQVTLRSSPSSASRNRLSTLINIANSGNVGMVAHGLYNGERRGFAYIGNNEFQSDRLNQVVSRGELESGISESITFTLVPRGVEYRLGLDEDLDGRLSGDERDNGTAPDIALPSWQFCANDGSQCDVSGRTVVRYGNGENQAYGVIDSNVNCGTGLIGDPQLDSSAHCEISSYSPPSNPNPNPQPVADFEFSSSGSSAEGAWQVFRFDVNAGELIESLVTWDDPSAFVRIYLRDENNVQIARDTKGSLPAKVSTTAQTSGTWSIGVGIKSGAANYDVVVNTTSDVIPPEPVEDFEFSSVGSSTEGAWQVFRFDVNAGELIESAVTWDDPTAYVRIYLRDENNTQIARDTKGGLPAMVSTIAQTSGTWSIGVGIKSGATNYDVRVSTSSDVIPPEPNPNPGG
ncbi:MAG: YncE family protein [Granulosicoccus sp.]